MGHSDNCNVWSGGRCNCGLFRNAQITSVLRVVTDRIREVDDELNETFRIIGKALIAGLPTEEFIANGRILEARISELKNVLKMLG